MYAANRVSSHLDVHPSANQAILPRRPGLWCKIRYQRTVQAFLGTCDGMSSLQDKVGYVQWTSKACESLAGWQAGGPELQGWSTAQVDWEWPGRDLHTITAARRRIVGDWPRLSARDCVRLFVQQSSARLGAHLDSMTYAHLVPRACACAVAGSGAGAGACLLQKPCCFLFSYKNKRRPLLHAHILSHNHINTLSTTTPPPKHSSPTKLTPTPINMPTYIVSLNLLRPYQNQS